MFMFVCRRLNAIHSYGDDKNSMNLTKFLNFCAMDPPILLSVEKSEADCHLFSMIAKTNESVQQGGFLATDQVTGFVYIYILVQLVQSPSGSIYAGLSASPRKF